MGGMVTIAARYKNNEVIKFKTSTNFFHYNMNSPHLLNEDYFKSQVIKHKFLKHDHLPEIDAKIYDNRKGILAPYDYGMILIDYANNTLLSANNYSPMMYGNSVKLLQEYADFLPSDFILKLKSFGSDKVENIDIREQRFVDTQEIHLIHMALKHGAKIIFKNNEVKHNGTLESVLENIYGIELKGKNIQEKINLIRNYLDEKERKIEEIHGKYYSSLDDYCDISFEYPDFKFIEGDSAKDCEIIYSYVKNNGFALSEYEEKIKELKKKMGIKEEPKSETKKSKTNK